jgi:hydrogenase maturation protein HypF
VANAVDLIFPANRQQRSVAELPAVRLRLEVTGAVQGVGFRPFAFRLAEAVGVGGKVRNTRRGAVVEIEGPSEAVAQFVRRLRAAPPPIRVEKLRQRAVDLKRENQFRVVESSLMGGTLPPPADLAVCAECLRELFDPSNRRYRYPFAACAACGPRFSITESVPYDRERTTMRHFPLCPACVHEYHNPWDRRFHAQATCCPVCGPQVELWGPGGRILARKDAAIRLAAHSVREGHVVALKGVGGFHLVVDARRESSVFELRRRKNREEKPFAVMVMPSHLEGVAHPVSREERALLSSPEGPIVLLRQRSGSSVAPAVAPGNPSLGVFLPTTPLHALLLSDLDFPMVVTSGNRSDEPICTDEREALSRLCGIADFFLVHNRPLVRPVEDSVVRVVDGSPLFLRRSRGYAPWGVMLSGSGPAVLAMGGHMKNTIGFAQGRHVALGPHGGDLVTPLAVDVFRQTAEDLPRLYGVGPDIVAADFHPDYTSTRTAQSRTEPVRYVQHHHAHFAACLAEHGVEGPALGVVWDGSGWGTDGTVWGGEFLVGGRAKVERLAHLRVFPLPGGEAAVRDPRRSALGLLYEMKGPEAFAEDVVRKWFSPKERNVLTRALQKNVGCVKTSSVGRLFDGVSALLGLVTRGSFEGQAAMAVEFAAGDEPGSYPFSLRGDPLIVDWVPLVDALLGEVLDGVSASRIAGRFHNTLAEMIVAVAQRARQKRVALTGGCFQNVRLLRESVRRLSAAGHDVISHRLVPPNDGGLALGQAAVVRAGGGTSGI